MTAAEDRHNEAGDGSTFCPECKAGKHDNCLGDAWDNERDMPTTCACWRVDHQEVEK